MRGPVEDEVVTTSDGVARLELVGVETTVGEMPVLLDNFKVAGRLLKAHVTPEDQLGKLVGEDTVGK